MGRGEGTESGSCQATCRVCSGTFRAKKDLNFHILGTPVGRFLQKLICRGILKLNCKFHVSKFRSQMKHCEFFKFTWQIWFFLILTAKGTGHQDMLHPII